MILVILYKVPSLIILTLMMDCISNFSNLANSFSASKRYFFAHSYRIRTYRIFLQQLQRMILSQNIQMQPNNQGFSYFCFILPNHFKFNNYSLLHRHATFTPGYCSCMLIMKMETVKARELISDEVKSFLMSICCWRDVKKDS